MPYRKAAPSPSACPRCGGPLVRVPRRPIDRLWSAFVPVRRYCCYGVGCTWEGNLRHERRRDAADASA